MTDDLGAEIDEREYNRQDMDRILVLNQRTKLVANRVMQLLKLPIRSRKRSFSAKTSTTQNVCGKRSLTPPVRSPLRIRSM